MEISNVKKQMMLQVVGWLSDWSDLLWKESPVIYRKAISCLGVVLQ